MSSRIAKPGAAKFKPVRQAPKKPPNPAAIKAAAPSRPSPSPAPSAPTSVAAPGPARSDAVAAKEHDVARKEVAAASTPGLATHSSSPYGNPAGQPGSASPQAALPPSLNWTAENQEAQNQDVGQHHDVNTEAPTPLREGQGTPSSIPSQATGFAISLGSLAAFEAQHNTTQPSPPSSPQATTLELEHRASSASQRPASKLQANIPSQGPKAPPGATTVTPKVGPPPTSVPRSHVLHEAKEQTRARSAGVVGERGLKASRNLEESDQHSTQTPGSKKQNVAEPVPPSLQQADAAVDPVLLNTQGRASPQAASSRRSTESVPGSPLAQEDQPRFDVQLPPLPPDSMLNSDDALMELIRAEVNAAEDNGSDSDVELEGSIYEPSAARKNAKRMDLQEDLPDQGLMPNEASTNTTRSGRKRAAPAGASKKGSASKRQRSVDDNTAEPGAKGKGKVKAKAKVKPKSKSKEPRAPPAEKNTVPRNFQPSVPGAALTMADILRGLKLPAPPTVNWRTGQDAPTGHIAPASGNGAAAADPDADEAGRNALQAPESGEEEEEEAGDLALESTRAIDSLAPLDPSRITMKSLIRDTGRGRPSSFMQRKIENRNEKRVRMAAARERMKLQVQLEREGVSKEEIRRRLDGKQREQEEELAAGGSAENEDLDNGTPAPSISDFGLENDEGANEAEAQSEQAEPNSEEEEDDGFAESQYAPQMRFVNGEMVVDESSTQIARAANDYNSYEVIEHENTLAHITSYTYGKAQKRKAERATAGQRTGRWTMADTQLFYEGLSQFGTDFEMIAGMFAYRDRRQIKSKWVREEKLNPERIDAALSVKKEVNLEYYQAITKMELDGDTVPADPMTRFYEGLPTKDNLISLASNRPPSVEPEMEAEIRRKKEETLRLSHDAETAEGGTEDHAPEDGGSQAAEDGVEEDAQRPLFNPASDEEGGEGDDDVMEEAQQEEPDEDQCGHAEEAEEEEDQSFDMSSFGVPIKSTA